MIHELGPAIVPSMPLSVAASNCNGGPHEPVQVVLLAAASLLLSLLVIVKFGERPEYRSEMQSSKRVIVAVLTPSIPVAVLGGLIMKRLLGTPGTPMPVVIGLALVFAIFMLLRSARSAVRETLTRRGLWRSVYALIAFGLVTSSLVLIVSMATFEASDGLREINSSLCFSEMH